MTPEKFESIFERQVQQSRLVLVEKAKEYAVGDDRLHNFKRAGAMKNETPEQALWGFLVKHLVSLADMLNSEQDFYEDRWDEKIGDSINYLFLLRAQVAESSEIKITTPNADPQPMVNVTDHYNQFATPNTDN